MKEEKGTWRKRLIKGMTRKSIMKVSKERKNEGNEIVCNKEIKGERSENKRNGIVEG